MRTNDLIEGLQILQPYYTVPDGYNNGAGHDVFYAYATDIPLPEEKAQRLFILGWLQPDSENHGVYEPSMGWQAFV